MSTAYAPPLHGAGPGPMSQNGPQHQGGPPVPPTGPGMPPPQHSGTPNGVPMTPQRPPTHSGSQNPQNIQRVSLFIEKLLSSFCDNFCNLPNVW
jgi:hypothetical protein